MSVGHHKSSEVSLREAEGPFVVHCAKGINGQTKAASASTRRGAEEWIEHFESRHIGCAGPHWIETTP